MSDYGRSAFSDPKSGLNYGRHGARADQDTTGTYQTTASSQPSMYVAYPQHGNMPPHSQPHSLPFAKTEDSTSYGGASLFSSRPALNEGPTGYSPNPARQIPQVSSWSPQQGPPGSRVFIFLMSAFELDPSWHLEAEFGSRKCNTTLRRVEAQGSYYQYALTTEVPPFSFTGWSSNAVPVCIVATNNIGYEIARLKLSPAFVYTDASLSQLPTETSKKRRLSNESSDNIPTSLKRTATEHVRSESGDQYGSQAFSYLQSQPTYAQQSPQLSLNTSVETVLPAYPRAQTQSAEPRQDSPHRLSQQNPVPSVAPGPARGRSPRTPSWNVAKLSGNGLRESPVIASSGNSRITSAASPSTMLPNPPLIRTSTLQQSPSPSSTPAGSSVPGNFNPYAMYPHNHKAVLKINGSLDSMTEGWSDEECDVKRRLVQFWRSQSGSTITTSFKPVAPEDRQPNSICISCIWWESRNEYYVTSVDTIYLLESLVAVRFTVEEKNRIRRNLEGFRPMTVSKGKSDSEDFFKLIMGFPNPKPRNIEKDVKVFPWKILSHALKKIISKYVSIEHYLSSPLDSWSLLTTPQSASYSSTAGALPVSIGSTFRGPQGHDFGGELLPASPHSNAESAISVSYQPPIATNTMASEVAHSQSSASYHTASPAMVPATVSHGYPLYAYPQSQISHSATAVPVPVPQPPSQHQQQPAWEFAHFTGATPNRNTHGLYAVDPVQSSGQYQIVQTSAGT